MEQMRQYADMKMMMAEAKSMEQDMKAAVDDEFEARYLLDGTRTRDVLEGGEKLASLTWVPGAPAAQAECLLVDDADALLGWAAANGCVKVDEAACLAHFRDTGELPDGCAVSTKAVGGKRGYVKVTPTKPYKAAFAQAARKMLEGGE